VKTVIAFPAYLPDQTVNSGVLLTAQNVYPATDGYRPARSFQSVSDPLDEAYQGGASFIASDATAYLIVGTSSDIYRLTAGAWSSLATGLTAGRWRWAQFGDFAIGVNGSATQEVDLTAGTASPLAGAPTGTCITVVRDQVVIGRANGDISMVQWSGFNNHTQWTAGLNQSGFQPMLTGGAVMGLAGGEYGIILQRFRLVRMTYTGDDFVYQFDEITSNVGCASAASIVQAGRNVYFLSDRGFMALEDGQALKYIGDEKVNRTFSAALARDDYELMHTAVDPQNSLAMWGVPGNPGTIWIYNWTLDRWATIVVPFTGLFSGFTSSLTLEEVSALYPDIDDMPYSFDDPRFSGGDPRLYVVDNARELGTLTGETLAVRLQLGFTQFATGRAARIRFIRPICDAVDGISITADTRARLGDAASLATAGALRASGSMPIRAAGRYIALTMNVAAGTERGDGEQWGYVQGLELDFYAGGGR